MLDKRYEIRCDGGSKFRERYCDSVLTGGMLKAPLKAQAKAAGWQKSWALMLGTEWICPRCQAAARGELPPERGWSESLDDYKQRLREHQIQQEAG